MAKKNRRPPHAPNPRPLAAVPKLDLGLVPGALNGGTSDIQEATAQVERVLEQAKAANTRPAGAEPTPIVRGSPEAAEAFKRAVDEAGARFGFEITAVLAEIAPTVYQPRLALRAKL